MPTAIHPLRTKLGSRCLDGKFGELECFQTTDDFSPPVTKSVLLYMFKDNCNEPHLESLNFDRLLAAYITVENHG